MRTVLAILIALGCTAGVVTLLGYLQPAQHIATQTALLQAPPATVWDRINDVADEPRWRKSVKVVTSEAPVDGKPCYAEHAGMLLRLCVQRTDAERLRIVSVQDTHDRFAGTWTMLVQPGSANPKENAATRLTITEDATIPSPFWRGVALVMGLDRGVKQYLNDLSHSFSGAPEQS